jgi:hypothetical protein
MSPHPDPHPMAGQTVIILNAADGSAVEFRLEDWWDRVHGKSWTHSDGNPTALVYAMRIAAKELPLDDEVVYGKISGAGVPVLVHASEILSPFDYLLYVAENGN